MVSPLQDLANRIGSNTLTGPQQAALLTALDVLIPLFPSVDDTAQSVPGDEPLSREWIAALYAIVAEGGGGGGGGLLPTNQPVWYIDPINGLDTNNGLTPATALQTVAALAALWKGTVGGGRPIIFPSAGTTITIHLLNDVPSTDPLAPILDVDIANGAALVIVGAANTPVHTGTILLAGTWSRTSANGQQTLTDAAVANFGAFIGFGAGTGMFFQDSTTNAVAWLYGPDTGSSSVGTIFIPYAPQVAAAPAVPAAPTAIHNGDTYTLSTLRAASLGQGFTTRSFPTVGAGGGGNSTVFFYRLQFVEPLTTDIVDLSTVSAGYTFQECQFNHAVDQLVGVSAYVNCFFFHNNGLSVFAGGTVECVVGGGVSAPAGTVAVTAAGLATLDADFAVFSSVGLLCGVGGEMLIGNAGYWNNGGDQALIVQSKGFVQVAPNTQATSVFYGTDGGTSFAITGNAGTLMYAPTGGTPAQTQLQFTNNNFSLGLTTSSFGVNTATAAYVGPTTDTFAHLDAALAAGTGFGGHAVDNATMSVMRVSP